MDLFQESLSPETVISTTYTSESTFTCLFLSAALWDCNYCSSKTMTMIKASCKVQARSLKSLKTIILSYSYDPLLDCWLVLAGC